MFTADYHCHSNLSHDASDPPEVLLGRAEEIELDELCITDHCDIGCQDTTRAFDPQLFWETMYRLRNNRTQKTRLRIGLELGQGHHDPLAADRVLNSGAFDFVIGSLHSLRGQPENGFYYNHYTAQAQCIDLLGQYYQDLSEMIEWGQFDVVGHIGYPLLYMMTRDGVKLPPILDLFGDVFGAMFKRMAEKGIGLELNLSNFGRAGFSSTVGMPPAAAPALRLISFYRECGGQIITLGSNAHSAPRVGHLQKEGQDMLRAAGFKYLTTFRKREPRFVPI